MRVLHIFNEIDFSGAEIMYANAAHLFNEEGYEMYALSTGEKEGNFVKGFESAGIKIFPMPFLIKSKNPFYLWKYLKSICLFIKDNHIDVIHIHRSNVFWYFSLCARVTRKNAVMTLHNVFRARKISWLKHYLLRLTARKWFKLNFQAISESVYSNELNYYKNPTILINNWYDTDKFFPAVDLVEKKTLRSKINVDENAYVIISIGRCTDIKNHSDIIKAMAKIKSQGNFVFLHLGSGVLEGQEKKEAVELGVAEQIYFLGNKENVRDYLIASDLFVMTSKFEGVGIAAIEAMACNLPGILYNSPGLRDLITNNDNGFLIKPDYELLAATILDVQRNPEIGKEKGNNAVKYVKENHLMAICVRGITELYRK